MQNENKIYEEFGKKLKKLREKSSYTQNEIAAELGISRSALNQYENGARKVPLNMIVKFSKLFNVSVDELIGIDLETKRKHIVLTDDQVLEERYKKWKSTVGYNKFTDEQVDYLVQFAKYLQALSEENTKQVIEYTKFLVSQQKDDDNG